VVIVLTIGPKVPWFKPAEDGEFLRAIQIRSTTFFGGEVKPLALLGMLKIPAEHDRDTSLDNFKDIFLQLPASPLGVSPATREL
jgi:hypothetical protein